MRVLHLVPTDSAGGAMRMALVGAGSVDTFLAMPDDLSCGPIADGSLAERVDWWAQFYDRAEVDRRLESFWDRIDTTSDQLVVWFSRHSACELAFFHACAERFDSRPWLAMDVTGRTLTDRVSHMQPETLMSLLKQERPLTAEERRESVEHWQLLRAENAPFRVAPDGELVSAPIDYFDTWLVAHAPDTPANVMWLVGEAMGAFDGQIGNVMLQERVFALIAGGRLMSDGDTDDMRSMRIWKPA